MYTALWSIWILAALQVSHPDSWANNRVLHLFSVCVCVCIHTSTSAYIPTRVKNIKDVDNTPIFLLPKTSPHAKQLALS